MVFSKIMRKTAEIGGIQSIKSYSVSCDGERQKKKNYRNCVCVCVCFEQNNIDASILV